MSLRARMGLAGGIAVAVAVVAVSVSSYLATRSAVYGQIDDSLSAVATHYTHLPSRSEGAPGGPGGAMAALFGGGSRHSAAPAGRGSSGTVPGPDCDEGRGINAPGAPFGGAPGVVQLLTSAGSLCRSPNETREIPVGQRARQIARTGRGEYFTSMSVSGEHIRVLVEGIPSLGALIVAMPLTSADRTLSDELLLLALIAGAGIALAALLGVLVARAAVAPIARFTRQTERIAESPERLEQERLLVAGGDELARLARAFNATLDALEQSIAAQRNLVADASHELRTPIATLRANLQLLRDEQLLSDEDRAGLRADMIEELDELTRLVADVVELARGSKPPTAPGEVRVDEIVDEALARARRRAPEFAFEAELEPTLVLGDGERIARAVTNLLDNATKWSPRDKPVEVVLRDGVLSVRDHGPGFAEQDLPFVFDRFHRASGARSKPGSGLGLAIVRQAADAHGGFADATNAADGGALVRIGFGPLLASPSDLLASIPEAQQ